MIKNNQIIAKLELKKTYKSLKKKFPNLIIRDVLDNIDFEVEIDKYILELEYKVNSRNYIPQKPYLLESPKNKGINRPTVVLSVEDSLIYRYCIEKIEDNLIDKTRKSHIHGGIKIKAITNDEGKKEYYEKWFEDWLEYNDSIKKTLKYKKYAVTTDIASYFENINILILIDLIRNDVKGKEFILNLLFFFLENIRFRYDYEVNTYNGLLQEDIDCSRILAYYFLSSHDERMFQFCKNNNSEYYRFVDDMTILVDSEVMGKKGLKVLTESLRKLGLLSSIEKTSIFNSDRMYEELFFNENEKLTLLESELIEKIKNEEDLNEIKTTVEEFYKDLLKNKYDKKKNWIKLLKRFYTIFSLLESDILFNNIVNHIINYPLLVTDNKILKYLIRNKEYKKKLNEILIDIIQYLESEENLYPLVECELLEYFLFFEKNDFSKDLLDKLKILSDKIFFNKKYKTLSNYARSISCLLCYKFNSQIIHKLANHYLTSNESDNILKKYLIVVSLTIQNQKMRNNVLSQARKEQDYSINRFINLIDNIKKYQTSKIIINFIKERDLFFYKDKNSNFKIVEKYNSIRSKLLKELIDIYKE